MRLAKKKYFHLKSNAVYNSSAKNQRNLDLIEIIQFCLKLYVLLRHPTYGWMYGWFDGWDIF